MIFVGTHRFEGMLAVADTVRPEAHAAVDALRAQGLDRIVVLTGDHYDAAEMVADRLGINDVWAGLLPEDKARVVAELSNESPTAMVGDGVNDAPALASATVGIAMGAAGTDAAMETADVVLVGDDLTRLPLAIGLSRQARRLVWQSLAFASTVIIALIATALLFGLRLAFGDVGHEGSTVIVVLNGLRLLGYRRRTR